MTLNYTSNFGENALKIRPVFAILFTTLVSSLLIWQRNVRSIGQFHDAVLASPATTSFLKQIIASLLGALWIYVAGAIFNLTTRLRLASVDRTSSLQTLNLWVALGSQRIDSSLPVHYMVLTLGVILAGNAIGSIWGGAITPILSSATYTYSNADNPFLIPLFNQPWFTQQYKYPGTDLDFNDNVKQQCETSNGDYGFVPKCPVPGLQNLVLDSARSATTIDGRPRVHSKNDNPSFSYLGRSYGAGSSQGLQSVVNTTGIILSYSYYETGYNVNSTCGYNSSSNFTLDTVFKGFTPSNGSDISLDVLLARGKLPNSNDDDNEISFPLVLTNQTSNPGILTWGADFKNNIGIAAIAASDPYGPFNKIQCTINFIQTNFSVGVNVTNSTIIVEPVNTLDKSISNTFDEHNYLIGNAMASLGLLAQTTASLTYENLGESLNDNWQIYNKSIKSGNAVERPNLASRRNDTSPVSAVEDSFNAMLDDILVGYGAAQLEWNTQQPGAARNITLRNQYSAIRLGQDSYIFATIAINILILLIAVEEAVRTDNWKQIPLLDYLDLKSVIVAVSAGGRDIAEDCRTRHETGTGLDGQSRNKEAADVRIRLIQGSDDFSRGPVIALARVGSEKVEKDVRDAESTRLVSE